MVSPSLIAVARGHAPADLLLTGARLVNVLTGEIEKKSVAIYGGRIAGVGDYRQARQRLALESRYLAPGLIDGHTHPESSLLSPAEYARAVVARGVTAVVTDLHELANVAGLPGLDYYMKAVRGLPLDMFFLAPSCVPATPLETSGAEFTPTEVKRLLRRRHVLGLGEMMNFPGVLQGDPQVLEKLRAAQGRVRDGHAPGLKGRELNAYIAAGIASDHESTTAAEGREKLRRGLHLMIREGSTEKNLAALLPLVNENTSPRCLLVVDDRSAQDLLREGALDAVVRRAMALGLPPLRALQLATINPARYFGLEGLGAIAPGYWANLLVLEDLEAFNVQRVFYRGRLVAKGGQALFAPRPKEAPAITRTMRVKPFTVAALALPAAGPGPHPVIQVVPGQVLTRRLDLDLKAVGGQLHPDVSRDILKLVVVERHRATGNIGRGLVKGFGLRRGALAASIAHDSHNIVAVGASDADIFAAVQEVIRLQGGLVAAAEGRVLASLALPIAGLLSTAPLEEVVERLESLERAARRLGDTLPAPFSALSFLALPVIPELRLTDRGLVDVREFRLIG